ncbi:MAG TPA: hypothetical protein VGR62_13500, partial [Candidatus Binatia bacterium]|nr:hypothetical protein [Candidatus Binatia bacterium]
MRRTDPTPSLALVALLLAVATGPAVAADTAFVANPDDLGNSMTAVFDSAVGERITAVSSQISCTLEVDEAQRTGKAHCSVPLTSIKVDND